MFLLQYQQMERLVFIFISICFHLALSQYRLQSGSKNINKNSKQNFIQRENPARVSSVCLFCFDLTQLWRAGGIERNFSLTITAADSNDLGDYSCVAINKGGMAERNITLTFTGVNVAYSQVIIFHL